MREEKLNRLVRRFRLVLVACLLLPLGISASPYAGVEYLQSSTPSMLNRASYVGAVDQSKEMKATVWLKLRNRDDLDDCLHDIYTPGNQSYHKFLTNSEFPASYGPSENDVNDVKQYFESQGFIVGFIPSDGAFVEVSAKVSDIEHTFHVNINNYMYEGNLHYSNNRPIGLEASIADKVSGVSGLDDFMEVSPDYLLYEPQIGVEPAKYTPRLFQAAYGVDKLISSGIDGTGQTIAVVIAYDNPQAEENLNVFSSRYFLPPCTTANGCFTKVNQYNQTGPLPVADASWATETDLDLQSIHSLAPNAKILLVEADSSSYTNMLTALHTVINGNLAGVISNSWGSRDVLTSFEWWFQYAAAIGITTNFSSGDYGDNKKYYGLLTVDYPSASPFVTAIGGTRLVVTTDARYKNETAWAAPGSNLGSVGGLSYIYSSNEWQRAKLQDVNASGYGIVGSHRAVPDISMDGDPITGAVIYSGGRWASYGGTSLACPQFSALMALANQARAQRGKGRVGLVASLIYSMPYSRHQGAAPITNIVGPESTVSSVLSASPGWNDITGLGSPYAPLFIESLASSN